MEFRTASVRYARERLGVNDVRSAPLAQRSTWRDGEFDLVCSFDVIEHVHDLAAFFDDCVRVAKPFGRQFHATPGADSITHRLGRVASRVGARRLGSVLTNLRSVDNLLGGPHVHLMGRRQVGWVAERHGLRARTEYEASYSYSDAHYAAVLPHLRWMPRPLGTRAFGLVRRVIRNKLLVTLEHASSTG
jgi:SAM-dependent methyltransferase